MSRSLLFYNLYPKIHWQEITASLLRNVPHDDIIVHVNLPSFAPFRKQAVLKELKKYPKIRDVLFSKNRRREGESIGFYALRDRVNLNEYTLLSYIHSKGSSKAKKNTQPIKDWTEYMRYFVVERLDLAKKAFVEGYYLYGVELSTNMHPSAEDKEKYPDTKFIYEGNFVTVDLQHLRKEVLTVPCVKDYYGVERFWGQLCSMEKAFCAHQSHKNHYDEVYPPSNYVQA